MKRGLRYYTPMMMISPQTFTGVFEEIIGVLLETAFQWRPPDSRCRPPDSRWRPPDSRCRPPDFHLRSHIFARDLHIFVGDSHWRPQYSR